jgi:hypothetical protein
MVAGFAGAIYSGRNPKTNYSHHLPYTIVILLAFSVHGSSYVLGPPLGDYMTVGVSLISALLMSFFFAFYPTRNAEIDLQRSVCITGVVGSRRQYFLLLVLENPTRQPVPPGSLFNIYDKRGGSYPFTHAHPFPVFSSSPRRLVFFIQCRYSKSKIRPSFTRVLYKNVNNGSYLINFI